MAARGSEPMSIPLLLAGAVTIGVLVYLVVALIRPEWF